MCSGTRADYDSITPESGYLYWLSDTREIIIDGVQYSSSLQMVTSLPEEGIVEGVLYYNSADGSLSVYTDETWVTVLPTISTDMTGDSSLPTVASVKSYVTTQIASGVAGKVSSISWDEEDVALDITIDDVVTEVELVGLLTGSTYDAATGKLHFTQSGGDDIEISLPVENFLSSAEYDEDTYTLTLTLNDETTVTVSLADLVSGITPIAGNGITIDATTKAISVLADPKANNLLSVTEDGVYVSEVVYTNDEPSVIEVGGIAAGTTFDGETIADMFDMLLYPELFPTSVGTPSCTFTKTLSTLVEVGTTSNITFTTTYSYGTVSPVYYDISTRGGDPNTYTYTGTGLVDHSPVSSTSTTDVQTLSSFTFSNAGTTSWTAKVSYDQGPQLLSSKGNDYLTPLAAGTTAAKTVSTEAVYAYYANTSDIDTMTKQSLKSASTTTYQLAMPAETGVAGDTDGKHSVEIVSTISFSGVKLYNALSGSFEYIGGTAALSLTVFTLTTTTRDGVTYNKYTHNSDKAGARTYQFIK